MRVSPRVCTLNFLLKEKLLIKPKARAFSRNRRAPAVNPGGLPPIPEAEPLLEPREPSDQQGDRLLKNPNANHIKNFEDDYIAGSDLEWLRAVPSRLMIVVDNKGLADILNGQAQASDSICDRALDIFQDILALLVSLSAEWKLPAKWISWRHREFNIEADAAANAVLDSKPFSRAGLATAKQGLLPEQTSYLICTDGALRKTKPPQAAGGWIVRRVDPASTARIFVGGRRLSSSLATSSMMAEALTLREALQELQTNQLL